MELATLLYNYERQSGSHKEAIVKEITDNSMALLYEQLCVKFSWQMDEELLQSMKYDTLLFRVEKSLSYSCFIFVRDKNAAELAIIDEKLVEATANAGDTEVLDCMIARAKCLSRTGQWEDALKAFDAILTKEKTSTGKKIDAVMEKAKIALFNMVCLSHHLKRQTR